MTLTATEIAHRLSQDYDIAGGLTVVGAGPLANEVAELLDAWPSSTSLIVVVSNENDDVRMAFQTVDDLGTVVLAAADLPEHVDVDVYCDLHVRGLTVVGLAY